MTVQSNLQQDARRRTDEMAREVIAAQNGAITDGSRLLALLEGSAQSLRHAAENVENRGLKLLLKVMAQERVAMHDMLRQTYGQGPSDPLDPSNKSTTRSVREGLQDIQTSMTVQRQGREVVTLNHLREEEEALLAAYIAELESGVAAPLRGMLESQHANIAHFFARLQLVGAGVEPIVARVFDTRIEGESAVTRLRERGLNAAQIDAAPITQVARPVLQSTRTPASPRNTVVAGALAGALVGGIIGGALALYVAQAPQLVGWVTVGPWALFLGPMLIGAFFGAIFGFFIGQNQREDDLAVTVDSLVNGELLVVAYPQPHEVAMVDEVLQVHHARELNR
jgi:hypothetical protein